MLELSVNSKSPAAITAALKKIHEMSMTGAIEKTATVHITLEAGIYRESIKYNLSNPLIIEGSSHIKAKDCVIQADNCEAFRKGVSNRAVFAIGPNVTKITIRNLSIINTHNKSVMDGNTLFDSAEALVWENTNGILKAEGIHLEGRQNTLYVKGYSLFKDCYIAGDTDFIYGEPDVACFENCIVHVREDNRGDYNGYAVMSRTAADKTGFVFSNCTFTADKRRKNKLFVYRTMGKGSATTKKNWDSAAFVNCNMSELFDQELVWDDDMNLTIYPRGNACVGIREYNTNIVKNDGSAEKADTALRNVKTYSLTEDDYFNGYSSRYLIFKNTPYEEI